MSEEIVKKEEVVVEPVEEKKAPAKKAKPAAKKESQEEVSLINMVKSSRSIFTKNYGVNNYARKSNKK